MIPPTDHVHPQTLAYRERFRQAMLDRIAAASALGIEDDEARHQIVCLDKALLFPGYGPLDVPAMAGETWADFWDRACWLAGYDFPPDAPPILTNGDARNPRASAQHDDEEREEKTP